MKHRPLLFILLAFASGIFLDYSTNLPFPLLLGLTMGFTVTCWVLFFLNYSGLLHLGLCLLLAFWAGAAYHHVRFYSCPKGHIANFVGEEKVLLRLKGVIVDMPITQELAASALPWKEKKKVTRRTRFTLKAEEAAGLKMKGAVLVNLYDSVPPALRYGQEVELVGRVFLPSGPRNPGQFNYRRYLQGQRPSVRVLMTVEDARNLRVLREGLGNPIFSWTYGLRERLALGLYSSVPGCGPTLGGLVLGTREDIPREIINDFIKTGTYHYLAISGLQVGMLVLSLYAALSLLRIPRRFAAPGVILTALLYALLTGLEPPVLRTALMVAFCFGAFLVRRQWDLPSGISAAVIVMLLLNPSDLFNVGFQLSALGVLGIVYLGPRIESLFWRRALTVERLQEGRSRFYHLWVYTRKAICASLGAWVVTAPLGLYYFHIFCPLGALITVIVFPLIWVMTVGGFILLPLAQVSALAAFPMAYVAYGCDLALKAIISTFAALPGSPFYTAAPYWPVLFGLYASGALFLWREGLGIKLPYAMGLCLFVGNIYLYSSILSKDNSALQVTELDVGQGSCTLIQFPGGKNLLYDAGVRGWFDAGRHIIAPALWEKGIRRIDGVIISHAHEDHFNALPSLVERFRIAHVLVGLPVLHSETGKGLLQYLYDKGVHVGAIGKGSELGGLSGGSLEVLNPAADWPGLSPNDASCVVMIKCKGRAVLLCGDIEERGIRRLLEPGTDLRADVIQAPHHGGGIANVGELLEAVGPRYVLVSAGSPKGLRGYRAGDYQVLETHRQGAITLTIEAGDIKARWYKQQKGL